MISFFIDKIIEFLEELNCRLRRKSIQNIGAKAMGQVKEEQIIDSIEVYNKNAELYFQCLKNLDFFRRKPFILSKENIFYQIYFSLLIDALNIVEDDIVVDFGAGTCWASAILNLMGAKTISIDISNTALEIGKEIFDFDKRQKKENAQFLTYDGHRFPIPDNSVDRIICIGAFHHVPNQQEILDEMFRVLREGGKAGFASEPGRNHSQQPAAMEEMEYGILENDIFIENFEQKSKKAGFTNFLIFPFIVPNNLKFNIVEYLSLNKRDNRKIIEQTLNSIVNSDNLLPVVVLEKGKEKTDSKHFNVLKAEIWPGKKIYIVKPNEQMNLKIRVKNIGDTEWLSEPKGGKYCVALGLRIIRNHNKINITRGYLPKSIYPNEEINLKLSFNAPMEEGEYYYEIDMVNEHVCWFCEKNSVSRRIKVKVAGPK